MSTKHLLRAVATIPLVASTALAAAHCTGDVVSDGQVDGGDLGVLLANWGPRSSSVWSIASDIDDSGTVDGADLGILLSNWGACPLVPWANIVEGAPNPAVVTDPALRAAIVATGLPWRIQDRGTGIEMLLVPPGTFQMGCIMGSNQRGCISQELPVHEVTLTDPFYLGRYEVTQAQWTAQMGSNPSQFQGAPDSASRPVDRVSWDTIQGYLVSTGLRLPTEAEWEFSCRAGTQTPFYDGSTDDDAVGSLAWYGSCCAPGGNSGGRTHAVGGKAANALGFHDMLGNVWEWVDDWYAAYSGSAQTNPVGPASATYRVLRGGSYVDATNYLRCSFRNYFTQPHFASSNYGFRVARNP